ncbi:MULTISPECIES: TetR/AcrR family transcriptional regulator [unclassified Pantoea]|uniref:TetR/AcrR family transcriptional regulator n=1 Tax=unclassified Pantoea TaxID=2630326 RepID=UPI001CD61973|nr:MULTISPECIES: TetR/AcrR family transcriptional regulator [unclassified Pantoea]MCA1177820.1 TetR/AcrR family transcriptional regulator [Pantoea sp. alder69]MCA1252947.1 TetR/AcrR family transcriptional regulator [Pantoea sp. alder70]MCA1266416.1 TetR/AcrR family transcriptional regulator [Pantoea sp. alder81]
MNTRVTDASRSMRKAPRQRRSQVMVDVILQAAARVLAKSGWAKFNTNEVARIAGVSIGSLYQYFPNKLALAEAIREQHLAAILQVLAGAVTDEDSLTVRIDRLIEGIIAAHLINPSLHRVLLDEVPLSERSAHEEFEQQYADFYRQFVVTTLSRDSARVTVVAVVLASAVEGVVHDAARRDQLGSYDIKLELKRLIMAYLQS